MPLQPARQESVSFIYLALKRNIVPNKEYLTVSLAATVWAEGAISLIPIPVGMVITDKTGSSVDGFGWLLSLIASIYRETLLIAYVLVSFLLL